MSEWKLGEWKLGEWKKSEWKNSDSIFILVSKNRDNIKTTQNAKLKHHPHDEKVMVHNIKQGDQMKSIIMKVDVGTDEDESPGGGGSPGAPVDHRLPSLHPRRPPPSSGTDTQK